MTNTSYITVKTYVIICIFTTLVNLFFNNCTMHALYEKRKKFVYAPYKLRKQRIITNYCGYISLGLNIIYSSIFGYKSHFLIFTCVYFVDLSCLLLQHAFM